MNNLRCAFAAIAAAFLISTATAGPIPGGPLVPPVAGESLLSSFIVGTQSPVHADWMVVPNPQGAGFIYFYQLENPAGNPGIDAFTLTFNPGTVGGVLAAGVVQNNDLDLPGLLHAPHTPAGFPNLAGENDAYALMPLVAVNVNINPGDDTLTWTFNPLTAGSESDTLFFVHLLPPTYGNAVAQNGTPPSPWGSLAPGGQPVPIPVPEPGSIVMLASAAGMLALRLRRR